MKFVQDLEIWKRFGKFGKGLEIWKRFGNFEKKKFGEQTLKFEKKIEIWGKNIVNWEKNLEIWKEIENLENIWKFEYFLEI